MENVRKHRGIKLLTTEARRNYLVSEPNYHTTILFFKETIGHKNEKNTQIFMRKLVYLGLSMLEISKALLHEFWYDYVKPKYGEKKSEFGYSFTVYTKTEDSYVDIAKNVEKRLDTLNMN